MASDFEPAHFSWVQFDKKAQLIRPEAIADLAALASEHQATDIIFFAHGWQNDLPIAEELYQTLWQNMKAELLSKGKDLSRIVIAGVLWPAKKYDANYDGAAIFEQGDAASPDFDGGGALDSYGGASASNDASQDLVDDAFRNFLELLDPAEAAELKASGFAMTKNQAANYVASFVQTANQTLAIQAAGEADAELKGEALEIDNAAHWEGAKALLNEYAEPLPDTILMDGYGEQLGILDGVQRIVSGPRNAVIWLLNKLTYFTMKRRAGEIGFRLGQLVEDHSAGLNFPIHLVGHSFGGRLVSAAAHQIIGDKTMDLRSVTLLQAAYSHNGIVKTGVFGNLHDHLNGSLVITHTHNDLACFVAYPIASRVSGDAKLGMGDADDKFGAMGANGPQGVAQDRVQELLPSDPSPTSGRINTVLADSFITKTGLIDAHNNVTNEACGKLVARAVTSD